MLKSLFDKLANFNLFKQVKVEDHDYGIYCHDNLDLAESELFEPSYSI